MRILLIGGGGTIGSSIHESILREHSQLSFNESSAEIIVVGRSSRPYPLDAKNEEICNIFFNNIGSFDALVCTFGETKWEKLNSICPISESLRNKAEAQIRVALAARKVIRSPGSVTLTSGVVGSILSPFGTASAVANAAIEAFVKSCSPEFPKGVRVNVVRPNLLLESKSKYEKFFPGQKTVTRDEVSAAYLRSIYGVETGTIIST